MNARSATAHPAATIAVLMHDGFYSCGTGAARSNRAFVEVLADRLAPGVRLAVIPIHLTPASSEYNGTWHTEMHALVQRSGGHVLPIDNGTGGMVRFGGLASFQTACASAAAQIHREVLPTAGPLLIVAFDCPFYGLATELAPQLRPELVLVARSTAALHVPEDTERLDWERRGLHQAVAAGARIAAISGHMRAHLAHDYRIPAEALLHLPNGLTPHDWRNIPPPDPGLLPPIARAGFLLAMGRAVPYKGFDDLFDALALLTRRNLTVPHTVLAAVTDDPSPNDYQRHLAHRITTETLSATLLPRFDERLRSLLVHPALAAVVVPSRVEPFGRVPLEAFVAGAAPVVATTAGGLNELVNHHTGYVARPRDPSSLADAVHSALQADTAKRASLRAAGRHLAATRYNYLHIVRDFLTQVAPWAIAVRHANDVSGR